MTAAPATPELMRDRLLQAIDGNSNICNMMVVVEVISFLEKYPITKETLEETRLGKLINDIRKKTKNEEIGRRARKLLKTWQKLIEPNKVEVLTKGHSGGLWSTRSGGSPCISAFSSTAHSGIIGTELKNRNDFNNCSSLRDNKLNQRKSMDDHKEGHFLPDDLPKVTLNDKTSCSQQLPNYKIDDRPELYADAFAHQSVDGDFSNHLGSDRPNKIPVSRVKPHSKVPGYSKPPSISSLLKASVQQKQARHEQVTSKEHFQPRSPHSSSHSPQDLKQEHIIQNAKQAQSVFSTTMRPAFAQGPSNQPSNVSDLDKGFTFKKVTGRHAKKKIKKKRSKDHAIQLDRQTSEKGTKSVMLQDKRLSFDSQNEDIASSFCEESHPLQDFSSADKVEFQACAEQSKSFPSASHCSFQQTDWKMLARSEIVQSYLSQQSSALALSGAQTPGGHFFMTEFLKKEGNQNQGNCKIHTLAPEVSPEELPGISREITTEDLKRLHTHRWSGVNGCYDTNGQWFDWSECISLDPQGDESKLNILPYVCLD